MKFEKPRLVLFQKREYGKLVYCGEFLSIEKIEKHVSKLKEEKTTFCVRVVLGVCEGGESIGQLSAGYPSEACILAIVVCRQEQWRKENTAVNDWFGGIFEDMFPKSPMTEPDAYLFLSFTNEFHFNRNGKIQDRESLSALLAKLGG
jgi:hypothetical protein